MGSAPKQCYNVAVFGIGQSMLSLNYVSATGARS